jgi:hypothetical protein
VYMRASFSEKIQNPRDLLKLKAKNNITGGYGEKINTVEPKCFAQTETSSATERLREVNPKCLQVHHDKDQDSEAISKTQSRSSRGSKIGSSLNIA